VPPSFPANASLPNPINAQFDFFATLRGYALSTETLQPGEPLDIDLYWQVTGQPPGNYLLFVHLIDRETEAIIAQRDTHPGLGRFPTSQWQPGDRIHDRIRLYLPETAYAPSQVAVSVGLYAPEGYRLGIVVDGAENAGNFRGDALPLGDIAIAPQPGDTPNPQAHNFGDELMLVGYDLDRRLAVPGGSLKLRLFWQPMPASRPNYLIQARLLDEAGNPAVIGDVLPQPGTAEWQPGGLDISEHNFTLSPALPPGVYQLEIALLNGDSQQRHPQRDR